MKSCASIALSKSISKGLIPEETLLPHLAILNQNQSSSNSPKFLYYSHFKKYIVFCSFFLMFANFIIFLSSTKKLLYINDQSQWQFRTGCLQQQEHQSQLQSIFPTTGTFFSFQLANFFIYFEFLNEAIRKKSIRIFFQNEFYFQFWRSVH